MKNKFPCYMVYEKAMPPDQGYEWHCLRSFWKYIYYKVTKKKRVRIDCYSKRISNRSRTHEWIEWDGLTDDWGGMVKCEVCPICWKIRQMNHHGEWKDYGILEDDSGWKPGILDYYKRREK